MENRFMLCRLIEKQINNKLTDFRFGIAAKNRLILQFSGKICLAMEIILI
jgi:hypothetical protein